jgi:quinol monooxygenase YgiN
MGIFVITCFKPKEGKDKELLEVVKDHIPILRNEDLITEKVCHVMKSKNGCIIEVFEWKSQEAINEAHKNKNILELWKRFENVCEYIPLSELEETKDIFPGFEPIEF